MPNIRTAIFAGVDIIEIHSEDNIPENGLFSPLITLVFDENSKTGFTKFALPYVAADPYLLLEETVSWLGQIFTELKRLAYIHRYKEEPEEVDLEMFMEVEDEESPSGVKPISTADISDALKSAETIISKIEKNLVTVIPGNNTKH